MTTVADFMGDFSLLVAGQIAVDTPQFYRIAVSAYGETFVAAKSGPTQIRLERSGDRLTFRAGADQPVVLTLKEANKTAPTRIRILCVPNRNFAGKSEIFIQGLTLSGKIAAEK